MRPRSEGGGENRAPPEYTPAALLKNAFFVAGSQASAGLVAVLYIIVARALGDAGFGDFTLGLTIAGLLSVLQGWGRNRYSAIVAAREPERATQIVGENLGATIPMTMLYLVAVAAVAYGISQRPAIVVLSLLLAGDMAAATYSKLLRLIFRVRDIYWYDTLAVLIERLAVVVVGVAALLIRPTATAAALGFLGGRALGAVATSGLFVRHVGPLRLTFDRGHVRRLFRAGTPLALRGALNSINLRADMLILATFRSRAEVGWYGAVYKLLDGLMMLPQVVLGSVSPHLSANFGGGRHEVVERLLQRAMKYLVVAGGGLSITLFVLAEPIVLLVYGAAFESAVPALRVLAAVLALGFLRLLLIEVLDNVDEREATVKVFAFGVALNIALNLLLVPRYGILGAAWCTVVSEAVLTVGLLWVTHAGGYRAFESRLLIIFAGGIGVGGLTMWLLDHRPLLAAGLGGFSYLAAVSLLGAWDRKDRDLARAMWHRARSLLPTAE